MRASLSRARAPGFLGGLHPRRLACLPLAILGLAVGGMATGAEELERFAYPLSRGPAAEGAIFEVDLGEAPNDDEVAQWANKAKSLGENWLPLVRRFLATDDWSPPQTIRLIFKQNLDAPAATVKDAILISIRHIKRHPDDFGMVIHELTHVVQNYPPGNPGWLVEGIADYIRYWRYEPEKPHRRIEAKASFKDGYRTSAAFLAWMAWKYDRRIVVRLDDALRHGRYNDALFQEWTGKMAAELWAEFIVDQKG